MKIGASKAVRSHAGKAVKDALNPPHGAPAKTARPSKAEIKEARTVSRTELRPGIFSIR
jgi:hypothetical protein